jgi:hypothetical protein
MPRPKKVRTVLPTDTTTPEEAAALTAQIPDLPPDTPPGGLRPETVAVNPKTGKVTGVLIPARNGGALMRGKPLGRPTGMVGRSPDAVRKLARELFADRLTKLADLADGKPVTVTIPKRDRDGQVCGSETVEISATVPDMIRAIEQLGKHALPRQTERIDSDDVRRRVAATIDAITAELEPVDAARVLARLRPIWSEASEPDAR